MGASDLCQAHCHPAFRGFLLAGCYADAVEQIRLAVALAQNAGLRESLLVIAL